MLRNIWRVKTQVSIIKHRPGAVLVLKIKKYHAWPVLVIFSLLGAVRGWVAVSISFKRRFVHCIIQSFFTKVMPNDNQGSSQLISRPEMTR